MHKFNINIFAAFMVKNEERRICVSLNSIKDSISGVVLYDTGSKDSTICIVKNFCNENNKEFFLLEGQFEDFSISRNMLFDFIDKIYTEKLQKHLKLFDYVLLLDSNDEYKGVKPLPDIIADEILTMYESEKLAVEKLPSDPPKTFGAGREVAKPVLQKPTQFEGNAHVYSKIKQRKKNPKNKKEGSKNTTVPRLPDAFMVKQRWFIGNGRNDLCYFNIKIVKPHKGFKYVEPVHEYIQEPAGCNTHKIIDGMEIYQDRVADNDGKTRSRWEKDVGVLTRVLKEKPTDARTQYYLAQTYECLENVKCAFKYYKMRSQNIHGFFEERFLSMMKCGYLKPGYGSVGWFLMAYDLLVRAEPLVELSRFFRHKKNFQLAFTFAKMACSLQLPEDTLLWSSDKVYSNDRWQEMAISAYYIQHFEAGEDACVKALESSYDKELNTKNLEFYTLHKSTSCNSGSQKP